MNSLHDGIKSFGFLNFNARDATNKRGLFLLSTKYFMFITRYYYSVSVTLMRLLIVNGTVTNPFVICPKVTERSNPRKSLMNQPSYLSEPEPKDSRLITRLHHSLSGLPFFVSTSFEKTPWTFDHHSVSPISLLIG